MQININDLISDPVYFEEAARQLGFASANIVEKDFWAILLLNLLFSEDDFAKALIFKGGTSLSKVFNIIHRFSEDLDLTIARSAFGLDVPLVELMVLGSKRKNRFLDELDNNLKQFVKTLVKQLQDKIASLLLDTESWRLYIDPENQTVVYFEYPRLLKQEGYIADSYIKPRIILEFGSRGAVSPIVTQPIKTYLESVYPNLALEIPADINTLSAERTFWEKATLLYMLYKQPTEKPMKPAMARHFYDLTMLYNSSLGGSALKQFNLLEDVIYQKQFFFKNGWVDYRHILKNNIQLIPDKIKLKIIEKDYQQMEEMFFNQPPSFQNILNSLSELEQKINELIAKKFPK